MPSSRVGFYFVWPSIRWYFLTPQADKDMAESSRNQIKVYAQERADEAIKKLVAMNARRSRCPRSTRSWSRRPAARYKTANKNAPATWTVQDVLQAYTSRADIAADAEDWYRDQMFALKDLKNQTMQLGLDLRGGMYVTIQVDYAAFEKTEQDHAERLPQREDKMKHDAGGAAEQDRPVRSHRSLHPHAGERQDHHRDPRYLGPRDRAPVHHGQGLPHVPHRG